MEKKEIFKVFGVKDSKELAVYCAKESDKLVEKLKKSPSFKLAMLLYDLALEMANSEEAKAEAVELREESIITLALGVGIDFILEKLTESEGTEE